MVYFLFDLQLIYIIQIYYFNNYNLFQNVITNLIFNNCNFNENYINSITLINCYFNINQINLNIIHFSTFHCKINNYSKIFNFKKNIFKLYIILIYFI